MAVKKTSAPKKINQNQLPKTPTGIIGFDEITGGGLPKGRPTLIAGGPGSGKTIFGLEFLIKGAIEYNEPGVLMSFAERVEDLVQNVSSLDFDLGSLIKNKKIVLDYVLVEKNEIEETGEYDLEGLFIRLEEAIDSVKATRVVLDTIESLFAGLSNTAIVRSEVQRLFRFLKDKGVTAVITGEKGDGNLTRQGLEEYISDCVIFLDHRVNEQVSTRRLRIIKYRGSTHGTNEYPFLIDKDGLTVMPITALDLNYQVSSQRITSGIKRLDKMLGGKGFFRGSTVLVSGTAGTGKTSVAASFAHATCKRGEKCLYFTYEEAPDQIIRNMKSIGINLKPYVSKGLLKIHASRPNIHGIEKHLFMLQKLVDAEKPKVVIIDPISNLADTETVINVNSMLIRLIDFLRMRGITCMFTSLTQNESFLEKTNSKVSSIIDTWILLRDVEIDGERNRALFILKSRGMEHSNQIREFLLTSTGIDLVDVYLGTSGVLTGSARYSQEQKEKEEEYKLEEKFMKKKNEIQRKQEILEAQIAELKNKYDEGMHELNRIMRDKERSKKQKITAKKRIGNYRKEDAN